MARVETTVFVGPALLLGQSEVKRQMLAAFPLRTKLSVLVPPALFIDVQGILKGGGGFFGGIQR